MKNLMKKYRRWLIAIVVLAIPLGVISCNKDILNQIQANRGFIELGLDFAEEYADGLCAGVESDTCELLAIVKPQLPNVRSVIFQLFDIAVELTPDDPKEAEAAVEEAMNRTFQKMDARQLAVITQAARLENARRKPPRDIRPGLVLPIKH